MPITKLTPENNYSYLEDRLKALEQAVPEAFADGKINWDTLREALGENLEDEGRDEYFGLNWPGKREARKRAAAPSRATLVPAPGEGVNEDTTENLFIEGDNLEVLKLLQKSYAGKIKMIYIDPPYNTGNDFIYNDNFTDPLEAYLDYTGARGESGELLTTNTRADGRFHSKWLNMMYPRMILARQLLCDDGVIFISIDDNEIHNLRLLMNEMYGEENFVANVVWQKRVSPANDSKWYSNDHEYLMIYAKEKTLWHPKRTERTSEHDQYYKNPDNDPRGPWNSAAYTCNKNKLERPNLFYSIKNPNTNEEVFPNENAVWAYSRDTHEENVKNDLLYWGSDGKSRYPRRKQFLSEAIDVVPRSFWPNGVGGSTQSATLEMRDLFEGVSFPYPKPSKLISNVIYQSTDVNTNDIVLDFFAGSATTSHALFQRNIIDSGNRKFILVQIPELTENRDYSNISEMGKERIRRVIKKITSEVSEQKSQLPLLQNEPTQIDLGFKVYKFSLSNYKQWKPIKEESEEALTLLFYNLSDVLIPGWKKENLLTEILLLEGFPLTSKVTYLEDLLKNEVNQVSAPDFCAHNLFVCLDETVQPSTIELLTMEKEDIFVCLDSALSDELKACVQDKFNVHVI
jgi:adenine-specific DNA-methyltransferase